MSTSSPVEYVVEPVEGVGGEATSGKLPYLVKVNGVILRGKSGIGRRFKDSITAAVAGAKEVDRLKSLQPRVIPARPIIRKDRSPMNPKVWVYQLVCGHDVFRANGKLRAPMTCEKCRENAK